MLLFQVVDVRMWRAAVVIILLLYNTVIVIVWSVFIADVSDCPEMAGAFPLIPVVFFYMPIGLPGAAGAALLSLETLHKYCPKAHAFWNAHLD